VSAWLLPGEARARAYLRGPTPRRMFPPTTDASNASNASNAATAVAVDGSTSAAAATTTTALATTPPLPPLPRPPRFEARPLPPPAVVVGYQRDWLKVAAPALRLWDKAPFEPYSGHVRDVSYVVIAPRGTPAAAAAAETLRELSATYELCGLGQHRPLPCSGSGGGDSGDASGFFLYNVGGGDGSKADRGGVSGGGVKTEEAEMGKEGEIGEVPPEAPRAPASFQDATRAVAAAVRALRRPTIVVAYVVAAVDAWSSSVGLHSC
jgi:hypothetical protein